MNVFSSFRYGQSTNKHSSNRKRIEIHNLLNSFSSFTKRVLLSVDDITGIIYLKKKWIYLIYSLVFINIYKRTGMTIKYQLEFCKCIT